MASPYSTQPHVPTIGEAIEQAITKKLIPEVERDYAQKMAREDPPPLAFSIGHTIDPTIDPTIGPEQEQRAQRAKSLTSKTLANAKAFNPALADYRELMAEDDSQWGEDVEDFLCLQVSRGLTLAQACRAPGMPPIELVHLWTRDLRSNIRYRPDFTQKILTAQGWTADKLAADMLEIADNADGEVSRDTLRVNVRKWLAEGYKPELFGKRTSVKHSGGLTNTNTNVNFDPTKLDFKSLGLEQMLMLEDMMKTLSGGEAEQRALPPTIEGQRAPDSPHAYEQTGREAQPSEDELAREYEPGGLYGPIGDTAAEDMGLNGADPADSADPAADEDGLKF